MEVSNKDFPLPWQYNYCKAIEEIYKSELENEQLEYFCKQIVEVSSLYLLFMHGDTIKVYTEFSYKTSYKVILDTSIRLSYKERAIQVVQDINEANIIISDSLILEEDDEIEFFYFSDIYEPQNWEELNHFLQKKLLQRGFPTI
ncbi:hypothetical protein VBH15_08290 [Vagococcus fluvialis]|uniref:hypothetical protein n=1 Tax=Vagococcus fluvialis TaxID=2738 RepID=UPI0037D80EB2